MHANTMNLFGISFILVSCLSSLCVQPALANWPVFSIEKGGTAVVPCVPKGDETAYFWSKGEDFATSQSVASRVLGIPSSDSEKYLVNEYGSLVMYNVTLAEGGRYHCRIVSENTNCRGAVSIEVTVNDFTFGIEQCEPSESCTLQVEPSKETKLTCTAKGGPSSLSLKWFNGSKEINSVSSESPLNEESSTISETITVPNEFGLPLTCEAVASEDGQECARLAHIRLDKTDTAKEQTDADKSSARWIIPLVLLIVAIVIIVFLLKYIYGKRGKYAKNKKRFNTKTGEQEKELGQKDSLLKQKGGELKKLQDELKDANIALEAFKKDLTAENMTLKTANGVLKKAQEDLTAKNKTLTTANGVLKKAQEDLTAENKTLTDANIGLEAVTKGLTAENMTLKNTNIALEKVKKDLTTKNTTLTDTNIELDKVKKDLTAKIKTKTEANGKLIKARDDLTAKNKTLTEANGKLIQARDDLTAKNKTLTEANGKLKKAHDDLTAKNKTLTDTNIALEKVEKDLTAKIKTKTEANLALEKAPMDLTAKNETQTEANLALEKAQMDLTAKNETQTDTDIALEKDKKDPTAKIKTQPQTDGKPTDLQDKDGAGGQS